MENTILFSYEKVITVNLSGDLGRKGEVAIHDVLNVCELIWCEIMNGTDWLEGQAIHKQICTKKCDLLMLTNLM